MTGAIGFTLEYPLHRYTQRARALAAWNDALLDGRSTVGDRTLKALVATYQLKRVRAAVGREARTDEHPRRRTRGRLPRARPS